MDNFILDVVHPRSPFRDDSAVFRFAVQDALDQAKYLPAYEFLLRSYLPPRRGFLDVRGVPFDNTPAVIFTLPAPTIFLEALLPFFDRMGGRSLLDVRDFSFGQPIFIAPTLVEATFPFFPRMGARVLLDPRNSSFPADPATYLVAVTAGIITFMAAIPPFMPRMAQGRRLDSRFFGTIDLGQEPAPPPVGTVRREWRRSLGTWSRSTSG